MKSIIDVLRDGVWQSIAAFLAVIALIWGFYTYVLDKPVYDLQVVILSDTSLVKITEGFTEEVKVIYAGRETENVTLIEIKLENAGNQSIPAASFDRPLRFLFPKDVEILKATQIEAVPSNLQLQINVIKNEVAISPTLLNPQDRVTIRFVAMNLPSDLTGSPFEVDARILGIKDIPITNILEQQNTLPSYWTYIGILAISLVSAVIGISFGEVSGRRRSWSILEKYIDKFYIPREVVIKCPNTGEEISVGFSMPAPAFLNATFEGNQVRCSVCREWHTWSKEDAKLKDVVVDNK